MDQKNNIILTEQQNNVSKQIQKFCNLKKYNKMLLLGPSGSGKTTVVVKSILNASNLNVCFCSFTNKATKVLRDMVSEYKSANISFVADFQTLHSLLKLEPKTIDVSDFNSNGKNISDNIRKNIYKNVYKWDTLKYILSDDEIHYKIDNIDEQLDDLLTFEFSYKKLEQLVDYDLLVIDEASVVSRELYLYLESMFYWMSDILKHNIKMIFLGDYYQLPPIGEKKSIVFKIAAEAKWPLLKLDKVMRSKTNQIDKVNKYFMKYIRKKIKQNKLSEEDFKNPYKILPHDKYIYIDERPRFLHKYVNLESNNKIIITYSNANCIKINNTIQNLLDKKNNVIREPDPEYPISYNRTPVMVWFKNGDRLIVNTPITIPEYTIRLTNIHENSQKEDIYSVSFNTVDTSSSNSKIYNGDIFIVRSNKNIKIRTVLNVLDTNHNIIPPYFNGQILEVSKDFDSDEIIQLIHVDNLEAEKTRRYLKKNMRYGEYVEIMKLFRINFTIFKRGYCVTLYKSQGSEWEYVFVNLKSIWACLNPKSVFGDDWISNNRSRFKKENSKPDIKTLFSSFYTACTRSSNNLYLYW